MIRRLNMREIWSTLRVYLVVVALIAIVQWFQGGWDLVRDSVLGLVVAMLIVVPIAAVISRRGERRSAGILLALIVVVWLVVSIVLDDFVLMTTAIIILAFFALCVAVDRLWDRLFNASSELVTEPDRGHPDQSAGSTSTDG